LLPPATSTQPVDGWPGLQGWGGVLEARGGVFLTAPTSSSSPARKGGFGTVYSELLADVPGQAGGMNQSDIEAVVLWRRLDLHGQQPSPTSRPAPPTPVALDFCDPLDDNHTAFSRRGVPVLVAGAGAQVVVTPGSEASRCLVDNLWVQDSASLVVEGALSGEPLVLRGNVLLEGGTSSGVMRGRFVWDSSGWNGSLILRNNTSLRLEYPLSFSLGTLAMDGGASLSLLGPFSGEATWNEDAYMSHVSWFDPLPGGGTWDQCFQVRHVFVVVRTFSLDCIVAACEFSSCNCL